jgi:hypothetical protein
VEPQNQVRPASLERLDAFEGKGERCQKRAIESALGCRPIIGFVHHHHVYWLAIEDGLHRHVGDRVGLTVQDASADEERGCIVGRRLGLPRPRHPPRQADYYQQARNCHNSSTHPDLLLLQWGFGR